MDMSLDEPAAGLESHRKNEFDIEEMAFGLPPISAESKQMVESLIKEEMETILQESSQNNLDNLLRNYLNQFDADNPLPTNSEYQNSLAAKHEEDVGQKKTTIQKLDFNRYSNFPVDEAQTTSQINRVTDQVKITMEYANSAVINAELMDKFKQESWQRYIASFQGYKQRLEREVDKAQRELEELNKRKREHITNLNSVVSPLVEKRDKLFNTNVALLAELRKLSSNASIKM